MKSTELELSVAMWWRQLAETNNDVFLPLFFDAHRYLVLKGGGGSGKSMFAGRKVLERCATEPGHRFLVVRKVGRTLRESCFEQLKTQAYEFYAEDIKFIPRGKSSDMYILFKNGSEIIFTGLDDSEKLKSIFDVTSMWIEEASELSQADFNQLDIRLRTDSPYYLQIMLSFNPISITHWLKTRFFDFDIKDPEARAEAIANTRTSETTYKDNRFLRQEAIDVLEAYKFTDPYYYTVYCLGLWGVTGKTVFDAARLQSRLGRLEKPVKTGFFEYAYDGLKISDIRWKDDENGPVKIYREPEHGTPYVIGADTAGDGSDWFAGCVLDNVTGRQVCTLRHRTDEDVFARQMYCLGMYYNTALVGVEANFSTFPIKELERLGYPKQYVREVEDEYTGAIRKSFGFKTTAVTRPVIIAGLIQIVRESAELINDESTILEMLTFVRDEHLRPAAEPGAHDDTVMAAAIAYYIRPQQKSERETQPGERKEWTEDMWEDYRGSDAAGREYLMKLWGKPK